MGQAWSAVFSQGVPPASDGVSEPLTDHIRVVCLVRATKAEVLGDCVHEARPMQEVLSRRDGLLLRRYHPGRAWRIDEQCDSGPFWERGASKPSWSESLGRDSFHRRSVRGSDRARGRGLGVGGWRRGFDDGSLEQSIQKSYSVGGEGRVMN